MASSTKAMKVRKPVRVLESRISIRHSAVKPCRSRMPQPLIFLSGEADPAAGLAALVSLTVRKIAMAVAMPATPNPTTGACHEIPANSSRLTMPPKANLPTSPKKL
ncbi:hypothetical protein D3C83_71260 [compost metagenome]